MKSDLDALMQERNIDALLVLGNAENNSSMYYFTGSGHIADAVLIKKRNEAPVLFCNSMERDEAAKSGLKIVPLERAPITVFSQSPAELFGEYGISEGRVGVYGISNANAILFLIDRLRDLFPKVEFFGEKGDGSVFLRAMETKEDVEVTRIRQMGAVTTEVVRMVQDLLTSSDVRSDEVLLKEDGSPLTVGDVKGKIALWLAERGAVDVEGVIFAIGHDAGVPHSVGDPEEPISLGKTIVFDIFPAESGGGYFYDFTRTWSLGYATPEAQAMYDQVQEVYEKVVDNLDLNANFVDYQRMTCEYFESKGHKSQLNTRNPLDGYVHGLGHGVGLNIHERPNAGFAYGDDNFLKPGVVITIEPGLYYPEKGMGFRIEDTYWVRPDGQFEKLAEYPYDFVLEMKNWKK